MPNPSSKTRPIFIFLGVTESGTDANITDLQESFGKLPEEYLSRLKIKPKDDLLILTLSDPDFCFYIAFVKNENSELSHWIELAKNFKLPWDKKAVNATRLTHIYEYLQKEGKPEYNLYQDIGFAILNQLEKFTHLKIFTIPSAEGKSLWRKIFPN